MGLSPAVQWGADHKELPRFATCYHGERTLRMLVDVLSECTDLCAMCIFAGGPRPPHPRMLLLSISMTLSTLLPAIAWPNKCKYAFNYAFNSYILVCCAHKYSTCRKDGFRKYPIPRFQFSGHLFVPIFNMHRTYITYIVYCHKWWRGPHSPSARRPRRTKSSMPEGPQTRSWGPEGR